LNTDSAVLPDESALAVITPEPVSETITLTFTGDCTFGRDQSFDYDTSFDAFYEENGYEYFFANVKSIFEQDDLTVVNFEGTLTDVDSSERLDKQYAFKADPSYVQILSSSGVDAANMANNHSEDYGEQSYTDTLKYLSEAGITTFGYSDSKVVDVKGVKVGLVGILELFEEKDCQYKMIEQIEAVQAQGAQIIVVTMHWGEEAQYYYDQDQYDLGRIAIDHGADLVIGHHPHRVQAIETYKGKNIVYSLGNFCFGGNYEPSDMDSFIYQQTFTVNGGELAEDNVTNIIPISISSASSYNNYQPTPYEDPDEIARIIAKIKDLTAEPGVPLTQWSSGQSAAGNTEAQETAASTDSSEAGNADTTADANDNTGADYSEDMDGEDDGNYDNDYDTADEEDGGYYDEDYADYDEEY
jgi:poly-gamma-glutamate synthesis protein (capsule biosynthesis protein)